MNFRYFLDMFGPCELVCSIQGCFNPVHRVRSKDIASVEPIPDCFKDEIRQGNSVMRTYELSKSRMRNMAKTSMSLHCVSHPYVYLLLVSS
jgi:hypothetical protein